MRWRTLACACVAMIGGWSCCAQDRTVSTWRGLPVVEGELRAIVQKTEEEWKSLLDPVRYAILRRADTERPFRNAYWDEHRSGTYYCAATGAPLFSSKDKFESGTGWPSFTKPIDQSSLALKLDSSYGMVRVEVLDSASGSHLGHVFDDGPSVEEGGTGLRYCMNSGALIFVPEGQDPPRLVKQWAASTTKSP